MTTPKHKPRAVVRDYIEMLVRVYPEDVTRAEIQKRREYAPAWLEDDGDYRRPRVVSVRRVKGGSK